MTELEANPEWVAMRARLDAEFAKQAAELAEAEAPLVEDLRAAGYAVESVYDLVNTSTPYPDALPILLAHFPLPYPPRIREGIGRALGVRYAKSAWPILRKWYEEERNDWAKEGLAVALGIIADKELLDEAIDLLRNRKLGPTRLLILPALTRSRDEKAQAAVLELKDDPDLRIQIGDILKAKARREAKKCKA